MKIALLHTAASNEKLFAPLCRKLLPGHECRHHVQPGLLALAGGGLTHKVRRTVLHCLTELLETADILLLTCSSLGPVVEDLPKALRGRVLRADEALARAAFTRGRRIAAIIAAPGTRQATQALFTACRPEGHHCDIVMAPNAWPLFLQGRTGTYLERISECARELAVSGKYDIIVLAQSSMAPAVMLPTCPPAVLTVPEQALLSLQQRLSSPPVMTKYISAADVPRPLVLKSAQSVRVRP